MEVATLLSRKTTGKDGNTRTQKKHYIARMQTHWELSWKSWNHEGNGWLIQVGTKEEPQLDMLSKEEGMEEQYTGKPK